MPKEMKISSSRDHSWTGAPYSRQEETGPTTTQRTAAIWSAADDAVLLRARASGLNWQPIAARHFPNKTANACRKRHERLVERRQAEDWDAQKLELLAQEYMRCRRQMWEVLAEKLGEKWNLVEAKCMEKGLKTLQSTARAGHRRASVSYNESFNGSAGNSDHHSDSGIGLGSDAELDTGDEATRSSMVQSDPVVGIWPVTYNSAQQQQQPPPQQPHLPRPTADHSRSRSLSYALPLYKPPPLPSSNQNKSASERSQSRTTALQSRATTSSFRPFATGLPKQQNVMGIQSMLASADR